MERIPFGTTGALVSQASLGCMLMGSATDRQTSYTMLDSFVEHGGTFLDTANCYAWWIGKGEFVGDESEQLVGTWMKERGNRDQLFLATKGGARLKNPARVRDHHGNIMGERVAEEYEYLAPDTIRRAVEESLRRLQTDYIDLYYAHIDDRNTPLEATLEALHRLVTEGKVRYIACSNIRTWRLERARTISAARGWATYTALQQQYSYLRPRPGADFGVGVHVDDELLDYLTANTDLMLLAYSPLLKGIYDDRAKRERSDLWPRFNTDDTQQRLAVLVRLANDLGVSNSQLVLAWLLHQPRTIPVLGVRTLEQFHHNMAALAIKLTDDQLALLNNATG